MKARNWKCILLVLALAGISLTVWAETQFSWVFPPYPIVYFHAYRSVDIFANPDGVGSPTNDLVCAVRFFDKDPDYVIKHPQTDVVKPNTWYESASYIGLTQVRGKPGLVVKFDYVIKWKGPEKTKGWEKLPPDCREALEVEGSSQRELLSTTGTFTVTEGDGRRTLTAAPATAKDPHILVIRNLDWNPIHVKLPAGTNPEQNFRVNGKSTFILVFYPNLHGNQLVFNWEWYKVSFEYIIKRIPEKNP